MGNDRSRDLVSKSVNHHPLLQLFLIEVYLDMLHLTLSRSSSLLYIIIINLSNV